MRMISKSCSVHFRYMQSPDRVCSTLGLEMPIKIQFVIALLFFHKGK